MRPGAVVSVARHCVRRLPLHLALAATLGVPLLTLPACESGKGASSKDRALRTYDMPSGKTRYVVHLVVKGEIEAPGLEQLGLAGDEPMPVDAVVDGTIEVTVDEQDDGFTYTTRFVKVQGRVSTPLGKRKLTTKDLADAGSVEQEVAPDGELRSVRGGSPGLAALPGVSDVLGFQCGRLADGGSKPGATWEAKRPQPASKAGDLPEKNSYSVAKGVGTVVSKVAGPLDVQLDVGDLVSAFAANLPLEGLDVNLVGQLESESRCQFRLSDHSMSGATAKGSAEVTASVGDKSAMFAGVVDGMKISLDFDYRRRLAE